MRKALVPIVTTFIVLMFLNLDGHPSHLWSPKDGWLDAYIGTGKNSEAPVFFRKNHWMNHAHGWPCAYSHRHMAYSLRAGRGVPVNFIVPPDIGFYSRWPFDDAPIQQYSAMSLAFNSVFALGMLIGVWKSSQQLPRLGVGRFGLKSLFAVTALMAAACAFELWRSISIQALHIAAMSYVGACVVWILVTGGITAVQIIRKTPQQNEGTAV